MSVWPPKSLSIVRLWVSFKNESIKQNKFYPPYYSLHVFINNLRSILLEFRQEIHILNLFFPPKIISIFKSFQIHSISKEGKHDR